MNLENSYLLENCNRNFILKYNAVQSNMNRFKMDKLSIVPQCKEMLVHRSNNMNYEKIYNQLIKRSREENRQKTKDNYYEEHHIIPKCIGGTNEKFNLVLFTAREHFVAHWILTRIYPNEPGIIFAWNSFCMRLGNPSTHKENLNHEVTSRKYEIARKKVVALMKTNINPFREYNKTLFGTTYINNGKINKRIKKEQLVLYLEQGWSKGRIKFKRVSPTLETRLKSSKSHKGQKASQGSIDFFKNNKHFWLSKNGQTIQVFEYDLEKYLKDGWIRGRYVLRNKQPEDVKYFKKEHIIIQIDSTDKKLYEKYSWEEVSEEIYNKRETKNTDFKFWVNKDNKSQRICEYQKEIYLEKGYKLGRGKRRK